MKNLLIKLGLWEEPRNITIAVTNGNISVDAGWYQTAMKHYCGPCERWFEKVQGKFMHNRHRHKDA